MPPFHSLGRLQKERLPVVAKGFPTFGWDLFHVQVMAPGCAFEPTLAQQVY